MNARIFLLIWCVILALPAQAASDVAAAPAMHLLSLRVHVSTSAESVVAAPASTGPRVTYSSAPPPPIQLTPGLAVGLLGAAIVVSVIDKADNSPAKKAADAWRFDLAPVLDTVPEFDFAELIGSDLGRELRAVGGTRVSRIELGDHVNPGSYERVAASARADGVLFVDVRHAIAPTGFANGPTYVARADFALVSRSGEVLIEDAVEFVAPHSGNPLPSARIAWWASEGRYFATLQRMSVAIAKVVALRLYGSSFNLANELPGNGQDRLHTVRDFLSCDDFHKRPVEATSFAVVRDGPKVPSQVGIVCAAAPAKGG
jgi:hypothetical protein